MRNLFILLSCLILSCSWQNRPDKSQILSDFEKEYCTYSFISSALLSRAGDTLELSIKFRKPISDKIWVDKWKYLNSNGHWFLIKTNKNSIISPFPPLEFVSVKHAMLQVNTRNLKVDSIIYTRDTFKIEMPSEMITYATYRGKRVLEEIYIPEKDKINLVYQRHLGNLEMQDRKE